MRIRQATAEDIPDVTRIYNQAVESSTASFDLRPRTVEDRLRWFEHHEPRHPVLVAESGGAVIGWGSLSAWSDRAAYDATVEISVYIDSAHQGRGLGREIATTLLDMAGQAGLHSVLARICTENLGSVRMMRSLGFTEAGTVHEVGHKFGRWLDVVTWEYIVPGGSGVSPE